MNRPKSHRRQRLSCPAPRRLARWATLAAIALLAALSSSCRGEGAKQGTAPASQFSDGNYFTVVVLPDTQIYSEMFSDTFNAQTSWVVRNAGRHNIAFVTHVGDVVNHNGQKPEQWKVADEAMSRLDGAVPWGVALGNHDCDTWWDPNGAATTFVKHFGPERFKKQPWYGGASSDGVDSYQFFTGCGMKFLILHLQCDTPDGTIQWAQEVLKKHKDVPTIVSTHFYLDDCTNARATEAWFRRPGNSPEELWRRLISKNPQVFMVLCGHHDTGGTAGEWHQTSKNEAGLEVLEVLADYQRHDNGGGGYLRIMRFLPDRKEIQVKTYSPVLNQYMTGPSSEFTLPLDPSRWRNPADRTTVPTAPAAP